ncbi:hypothetical protein HK102_010154 [Quaeritorhiza haematococci]|nr:hypothetical protein HK102_010154 [Quaeritorhiza haematococci]
MQPTRGTTSATRWPAGSLKRPAPADENQYVPRAGDQTRMALHARKNVTSNSIKGTATNNTAKQQPFVTNGAKRSALGDVSNVKQTTSRTTTVKPKNEISEAIRVVKARATANTRLKITSSKNTSKGQSTTSTSTSAGVTTKLRQTTISLKSGPSGGAAAASAHTTSSSSSLPVPTKTTSSSGGRSSFSSSSSTTTTSTVAGTWTVGTRTSTGGRLSTSSTGSISTTAKQSTATRNSFSSSTSSLVSGGSRRSSTQSNASSRASISSVASARSTSNVATTRHQQQGITSTSSNRIRSTKKNVTASTIKSAAKTAHRVVTAEEMQQAQFTMQIDIPHHQQQQHQEVRQTYFEKTTTAATAAAFVPLAEDEVSESVMDVDGQEQMKESAFTGAVVEPQSVKHMQIAAAAAAAEMTTGPVTLIDDEDDDPLMVADYAEDIYLYLKQLEVNLMERH